MSRLFVSAKHWFLCIRLNITLIMSDIQTIPGVTFLDDRHIQNAPFTFNMFQISNPNPNPHHKTPQNAPSLSVTINGILDYKLHIVKLSQKIYRW